MFRSSGLLPRLWHNTNPYKTMTAAKRIKKLERELNQLRADIASEEHMRGDWAEDYMKLVEEIPMGYPDGTGILTPHAWVRWAKRELGYECEATNTRESG